MSSANELPALSINATLYYTTGTRGSWAASPTGGIYVGAPPALTLFAPARDVKINSKWTPADFSSRLSRAKLTGPALQDFVLTFNMPWTPQDAGCIAVLAAHAAGTSIAFAALDGPCAAQSNASGIWADFSVMEFENDQPLEKEQLVSVTLNPTMTASGIPPQWVQCGG